MLFYTSIAAYFSAQELGPFFDTDVPFLHNIIAFDIYIISLTITCLVVAAIKHDLDLIQGQLKREKRQAEHLNQLKTQFIANVNHEIRTPVTGVVGASNLLRETNINSDQQRLLDVIDESSNHLLTLINDVLDFSKQESDKIELENTFVDIEELLKGVTRSFVAQAENKGVDLLVDCNPALSNYLGDPTAIGQILRNLVSNALKFTDTGHIAITASSMANGLKLTIQDTGIGISEDQQKHIFDAFVQEDASINRRFGGTGLGLAICKKLTALMGGKITVESRKGEGTLFCVTLILAKAEQKNRLPEKRAPQGIVYSNDPVRGLFLSKTLHLLVDNTEVSDWGDLTDLRDQLSSAKANPHCLCIIDWHSRDSATLQQLLLALSPRPDWLLVAIPWSMEKPAVANVRFVHRPTFPSDFLSALDTDHGSTSNAEPAHPTPPIAPRLINALLAEDNPINARIAKAMLEKEGCKVVQAENGQEALDEVKNNSFDIVFMDVQMPVMDGLSASREIKKLFPRLPIVAFTANFDENLELEFAAAGMDNVLPKPFKRDDMSAVLRKVL